MGNNNHLSRRKYYAIAASFFLLMCLYPSKLLAQGDWEILVEFSPSLLTDLFFVDHKEGWMVDISLFTPGIRHTTDGGMTWEFQEGEGDYFSVFFLDNDIGWVGGMNGLLRHTIDGGKNWVVQETGVDDYLLDIFFLNEKEGWIAGGTAGFGFATHLIIHTDDAGETWEVQQEGNHISTIYNDIFFSDTLNGLVVGRNKLVYYTDDGGDNWNEADFDYGFGGGITSLSYFGNGKYLGAGYRNLRAAIYKSLSYGQSWSLIDTLIEESILMGISIPDFVNGWAVGTLGGDTDPELFGLFLRTMDGGDTWNIVEISTGNEFFRSLMFINPHKGWMIGNLQDLIQYSEEDSTYPNPPNDFLALASENNVILSFSTPVENTDGSPLEDLEGYSLYRDFEYRRMISAELDDYVDGNFPNGTYSYFLRSIDVFGNEGPSTDTVQVTIDYIGIKRDEKSLTLSDFKLYDNYPNPFNSSTRVEFTIQESGFTRLIIYDLLGREVSTLVNNDLDAGLYSATWETGKASSGIYFYKLTSGDFIETKKMLFLK